MIFRLFVIIFLLKFSISCCGEPVSSLEKSVTLDIWGGTLAEAIQQIKQQTGISIVYFQKDFENTNTDDLFIVSGNVTIGTVLESLARRYSFRYQVSPSGRIAISRSYDWVTNKPILRFIRLPAIFGNDITDCTKILSEFLKPLSLIPASYKFTVEKTQSADGSIYLRCVAALPPVLMKWLEDLANDSTKDVLRNPTRVTKQANWDKLLSQSVVLQPKASIHEILKNTAAQTNSIIIIHTLPDNLQPSITIENAETFGALAASLSERYSLGKRTFLACNALLFDPQQEPDLIIDVGSREFFWEGLSVAKITVPKTVATTKESKILIREIREKIFPNIWSDPACSIQSLGAGGTLAIIAPEHVIESIQSYLSEM